MVGRVATLDISQARECLDCPPISNFNFPFPLSIFSLPLRRSATVSQTSRSRVASQTAKICLQMFSTSRSPRSLLPAPRPIFHFQFSIFNFQFAPSVLIRVHPWLNKFWSAPLPCCPRGPWSVVRSPWSISASHSQFVPSAPSASPRELQSADKIRPLLDPQIYTFEPRFLSVISED